MRTKALDVPAEMKKSLQVRQTQAGFISTNLTKGSGRLIAYRISGLITNEDGKCKLFSVPRTGKALLMDTGNRDLLTEILRFGTTAMLLMQTVINRFRNSPKKKK